MGTAIAIAFICFVASAIVSGVTTNRYYQTLARKSDAISSNQALLDEFLHAPAQMPRANAAETKRRLSALLTRQTDPALEGLRRAAVVATLIGLGSFVAIVVLSNA
jgi:hypothetical protein